MLNSSVEYPEGHFLHGIESNEEFEKLMSTPTTSEMDLFHDFDNDDYTLTPSGRNLVRKMRHYREQQDRDSESFLKEIRFRSERTPDFRNLSNNSPEFLVFVYGTLKRGYGNNRLLRDAKFLGEGETYTAHFLDRGLGFPIVMKKQPHYSLSKIGKIVGEVYCVSLDDLCNLDHLENNGIMYNRSLERIVCRDQNVSQVAGVRSFPYLPCFMYFGNIDYWKDNEDRFQTPVEGRLKWSK